MKRALSVMALMTGCTCSVPFEIIGLDARQGGGDSGRDDAGAGGAGASDGGADHDAGTLDAGAPDAGGADGGMLDGGVGDAGSDPCLGLAADACAATAGCIPQQCTFCDCTEHYLGCFSSKNMPPLCPDCPSLQCCRSSTDCADGLQCHGPGEPLCSASCLGETSCVALGDALCLVSNEVCSIDPCCPASLLVCVPPCTVGSCPEGQACDTARQICVATSCADDTECPPFFGCVQLNCDRWTCSNDSECAGLDGGATGYCVNNKCFATEGMCIVPPP
jgi:hypothetical protein